MVAATLSHHPHQQMVFRYKWALFAVAIVIAAIATISFQLVAAQINEVTSITRAGKQRAISQQVARNVQELLLAQTASERGKILQSLNHVTAEMEKTHQLLLNELPTHSPDIARMYYEKPFELDARITSYIRHARNILTLPYHELSPQQPDVAAIFHDRQDALISHLEMLGQQYQDTTISRFDRLQIVIIGLSVIAVLILGIIGTTIFRPAISYITQAQQKIIELNQLKSDFLANMSHEIRTPMNGIFGMTELLIDSGLNQRQQHYARTLQNLADHLLGLLNDILDFSKLEADQMKLDPVHFNLLSTMEDVLDLLSARAREKNLELLLRYAPGAPRFVVADPGRIRQVLFNLIGNAIKFTDKGYVLVDVNITSHHEQDWRLHVQVEDTGVGIPEDKIVSLFEKFMQVESGSTRARQGTGLGLAISRNLVQLMGGDIRVESAPGKGTRFSWSIPLAEASEPQHKAASSMTLQKKRALIVDDLEPNRMMLKETLNEAGVECMMAENASEALSILAYEAENKRTVDVLVTDYMMPGMDGLRLTSVVRSDPRFAALPIMICSSEEARGLLKRFDDAGANACLTKPIARQQLLDTLVHVLEAATDGKPQSIITNESSQSINARKLLARNRPLYGTQILLVEDNKVNLEITSEILTQFGCQVTTVEHGEKAIDAVKAHAFDLIFMDCQMPVMDGFEAARHICALKKAGQIAPVPIIALTANALKGDRERCLESGMDDYVGKPVRKANLEAILLKWLRQKLEDRAAIAEPAEETTPEPADSVPSTTADHVDLSAFTAVQQILGAKLATVLTYYLEDAETYIRQIDDALSKHNIHEAIRPAHSLKSSSRQFGARQLSDMAAQVEEAARTGKENRTPEEWQKTISLMRTALEDVKPFYQSALSA